VSKE
jgi:hypothetical protein